MLHKSLILLVLAAGAVVAVEAARSSDDDRAARVERGRYLVGAMMCNDCHTPLAMTANGPAPDMSRMLSGHPQDKLMPAAPTLPEGPWNTVVADTLTAWSGPWGVSYTKNLTPDRETGLGEWTEEEFVATIRGGRHRGRGRQLLPPMPWQMIGTLTDADLSAMWAYLQSIPAVSNRVPEPLPPAHAAAAPAPAGAAQ
jgi:hypothetical protein